MKKRMLLLAIGLVLVLTACSAKTITEHAGNYLYAQNEAINILDIDTRDSIATLTMTGTAVLLDEPFTIAEPDGVDEDGNELFVDVAYEQLVQVFYRYDSRGTYTTVSAANFLVRDSSGDPCRVNPDIAYTALKRSGEKSFAVALKTKGDSLYLDFRHGLLQTTVTARIALTIGADFDDAPHNVTAVMDSSDAGSDGPGLGTADSNSPDSDGVDPRGTTFTSPDWRPGAILFHGK